MRTFQQYSRLREGAALDVGAGLAGGGAGVSGAAKEALIAASQAFEMVMAENPAAAVNFLTRMAASVPSIGAVLAQHNLESFKDGRFRADMRKAALRGRKNVPTALGDVSPADLRGDADAIAGNPSDSFHNPTV